ncbi:hypothetical protein PR048_006193 [Dryococelus australis]|uniref:Uncharacterized protein n=1 Tax=Dryococelus australis TaxID=614101 RepID=A0ABQ9IAB2_9NEOP|nr:hypothetical protein PR048_006193 [Dryococelus australis]
MMLSSVNPSMVEIIKTIPGPTFVETEEILADLNRQASEGNTVDIVAALTIVKLSTAIFATNVLEAIRFPYASVDC